MGSSITETDQDAGVIEEFGHTVYPGIERGHGELAGEIISNCNIQESVHGVLSLSACDFSHSQSLQGFQRVGLCLVQGDALPVTECKRVFEFFPELISKCSVFIDGYLRLFRRVLEQSFPGRESGEGEWATHVDFAGQR